MKKQYNDTYRIPMIEILGESLLKTHDLRPMLLCVRPKTRDRKQNQKACVLRQVGN